MPLLAADPDGVVEVFSYGRVGRPVLRRLATVENLLTSVMGRVLDAPHGETGGYTDLMLGGDVGAVKPQSLPHLRGRTRARHPWRRPHSQGRFR